MLQSKLISISHKAREQSRVLSEKGARWTGSPFVVGWRLHESRDGVELMWELSLYELM